MTLDSPILALLLLPIAIAVIALAATLAPPARWLLRTATVSAVVAVAGVNVRYDRPPRVAVMIDESPSTRGALFRDPAAVAARLAPLLNGRPYTIHYFADGALADAVEPRCERTRLDVPPGVDAVVLLSDGRFDPPAAPLPPTFVVIDPALDRPIDARVRDVRPDGRGGATADVVSAGPDRPLAGAGLATPLPLPAGPAVVPLATPAAGGVGFPPGDRWPENDTLAVDPDVRPVRRLAVGRALPGFESARALPDDLTDVSVLVLPTDAPGGRPDAVESFVRDFGGTLVLVGPPDAAPRRRRDWSPLSATPPAGPQAWTILLDASGSMASTAAGGTTRWAVALDAAKAAVDRLPAGATVTVLRFAAGITTLADGATPAAAVTAIDAAAAVPPAGPTGLRAALDAIAARDAAAGPTRVLLIGDGDADLGDTAALGDRLRAARVTLDAVLSTDAPAVAAVCAATGGRAVPGVPPAAWADAAGGVAARRDTAAIDTVVGRGMLTGQTWPHVARWPAWAKRDAEVLADTAGGPAVAAWSVGLGCVVAVSAELPAAGLAAVATVTERPPADPRFAVVFDPTAGVVRLAARDAAGPMNGLTPTLGRAGRTSTFVAVAPGTYEASLDRRPEATVAVVRIGGRVVARRSIAGRYAEEFDALGNDREALAVLARDSGGAVIEPGTFGRSHGHGLRRRTRCGR